MPFNGLNTPCSHCGRDAFDGAGAGCLAVFCQQCADSSGKSYEFIRDHVTWTRDLSLSTAPDGFPVLGSLGGIHFWEERGPGLGFQKGGPGIQVILDGCALDDDTYESGDLEAPMLSTLSFAAEGGGADTTGMGR